MTRASPTREEVFEPRVYRVETRERSRKHPSPDLSAVNARLNAGVQKQGANDGVLKFDHCRKRAVSISSLEAVTGQEAHFRSEGSSIRTVTPDPDSTVLPTRDRQEATEDWRMLQLQEDIRLNAGKMTSRGVLKRERGGVHKPGVAFDFPGPVIDKDVGDDKSDAMKKADIELERTMKRYK